MMAEKSVENKCSDEIDVGLSRFCVTPGVKREVSSKLTKEEEVGLGMKVGCR